MNETKMVRYGMYVYMYVCNMWTFECVRVCVWGCVCVCFSVCGNICLYVGMCVCS